MTDWRSREIAHQARVIKGLADKLAEHEKPKPKGYERPPREHTTYVPDHSAILGP